jgi:putative beta-1,4-xylosyltransferase IRX9
VYKNWQETTFIQQLIEDETQMEAVPSDCAKILNWHLHLDYRDAVYPKGWHLSDNLHPIVPLKL